MTRKTGYIVGTIMVVLGCCVYLLIRTTGVEQSVLWTKQHIYWPLNDGWRSLLRDTIYSRFFICAVVVILILERLYPVKPDQKMFSKGFLQDSVWLFAGLLFEGVVAAAYAKAIKGFCAANFGFFNPEFSRFPEMGRFIIGLFLSDFLAWFQHWLKHKIPWLWQFHTIHHSQREINMFTDLRLHFLEYLISRTIVITPMAVLGINTPSIAAYTVFNTWFTRLYHANIKSNLGFLRYIFVTPQSHRIHHSIEKRHQDKNFGVIFSFWDRIFRTQHEDYEEYPETGIEDPSFPLEKETSLLALILVPCRQLIYPFLVIGRSLKRKNKG